MTCYWPESDTTNCHKTVALRTDLRQMLYNLHSSESTVSFSVSCDKAHWRTGWRYVLFFYEIRPCFGTGDGCVLVWIPGECLQPTCLRSTHTGTMSWGVFSYYCTIPPLVSHCNLVLKAAYSTCCPSITTIILMFSNRKALALILLL